MPPVISAFALNPLLVFRHSGWKTRVPLCRHDKRDTNDNQEKRKELASRERPDQFGIGLAEVFDHDSKDRVANEKQSGQNAVWLGHARSHKPENREQRDPLEKCFV
jgi:hypothetical protein